MTHKILIFLLGCPGLVLAQSDFSIDTLYFPNGAIERIVEHDSAYFAVGLVKEYDSTGILRIEGRFARVDSADCISCYVGASGYDFPGKWYPVTRIGVGQLKAGQWITYHPNGRMSSFGQYDTLFTLYCEADNSQGTGRAQVSQRQEQLKAGVWRYYDETGKLYLREEYFRGTLVFKAEYD